MAPNILIAAAISKVGVVLLGEVCLFCVPAEPEQSTNKKGNFGELSETTCDQQAPTVLALHGKGCIQGGWPAPRNFLGILARHVRPRPPARSPARLLSAG